MRNYTREEAIKMLLDGKQMTSDAFAHPDDAYCVYDPIIKSKLPFVYIYKNSRTLFHSIWGVDSWRERKYIPEDKELVWSWNDDSRASAFLKYYDNVNNATFTFEGKRGGLKFMYYAPFDGTPPPNICKPEELED